MANRIEITNPETILDVGCGPGNSSRIIKDRFPGARVLGIDNSENMIKTDKSTHADIDFMLCDAGAGLTSISEKFDIVFSNACFQWIPNHKELIENMMSLLNPSGVLAVQVPKNYEEPIHKIMIETSRSDKWNDKINNPRVFYTLTEGGYFDLLSQLSNDFEIWQTTYFHKMASHADIMEWYRGTGLRPYLNLLSDENKTLFENDVYTKLLDAYPKQENGEVIFRFPRLFFIAVKSV